LFHLEHVKAPSTLSLTRFGQAIELRQPQTEYIKRILCCRVKVAMQHATELYNTLIKGIQQH
jgi:hypothetical protein